MKTKITIIIFPRSIDTQQMTVKETEKVEMTKNIDEKEDMNMMMGMIVTIIEIVIGDVHDLQNIEEKEKIDEIGVSKLFWKGLWLFSVKTP